MKSIVTRALIFFLACAACTPPPLTTQRAATPLEHLPLRAGIPRELGATCDILVHGARLRTRARVGMSADTVNIALVDEFGVALAQAATAAAGVDIVRVFPPASRETAVGAALCIRAFLLAASRRYDRPGTFAAPLSPQHSLLVFASGAAPDSLHISIDEKLFFAAYLTPSAFVALDIARDTVLVFTPDTVLFEYR